MDLSDATVDDMDCAGSANVLSGYLLFRQAFEDMLDPALYPIEWLDRQVWEGRIREFGSERGCVLAELRTYPTGAREVHVMAAAGELDEIVGPLRERMEAWAKELRAFVGVASRAGWERVLAPHGYRKFQVELRKEV